MGDAGDSGQQPSDDHRELRHTHSLPQDDHRAAADGGPESDHSQEHAAPPGEVSGAEAGHGPAADVELMEAAAELAVTEVDPLVRVELAKMVQDVGALVEPTFESEASAAMEPDAAVLAGPEPAPSQERPVEGEAPDEKPSRRARRERVPGEGNGDVPGTGGGRRDGTVLSLTARVESLLFVADGAVPVSRLAEALEVPAREVEQALAELQASYQQRGLSVQRFRDRVQLTTAPAAAPLVERFLGLAASTPLSRAALEALAIIAYQQPVTRPQIEAVRGVNSDSVIKNLLTKGLIEEAGRAEGPGRPVLYSTTTEFMQHFGLNALSDLPPLTPPGVDPGETISELLKG